MKRSLIILSIIISICLCSCQTAKAPGLYSWYGYTKAEYNLDKIADEEANNKILATYEQIINDQNGQRGAVPPGIYADYGWLLIQNNKVDEGVEMLYAEIELYPESEVFITRMLKELGIK